MIKSWLLRLGIGAAFALPLMLVSVALAQAGDTQAVPTPAAVAASLDCQDCHESFYKDMESGAHGAAATSAFVQVWEQQASPQACLSCHTTQGMTCQTCHSPMSAGHPDTAATVNRSAEACGECHKATYLGWQVSQHGQGDLTCVDCHDAHATGREMKGDTSMLCANCHKDADANYAHKVHVPVGLTCGECHLTPPDQARDPHTMRDHSFAVKVQTCDACHTSRALTIAAVVPTPSPTPVDSLASSLDVTVSATPQPVSPLGFATLSILVGFGVGVVVAPWAERWYRRSGNKLFKQ